MRPVTIDKLDMKVHERYAKDQQTLDPAFIKESIAIGAHSEIAGTSVIYASNWEILFDLQVKNIPWAIFSPPLKYTLQSNRFFTYQILPTIYLREEVYEDEEENEEKDQKRRERKRLEIFKKIINTSRSEEDPIADFEQEKTSIVNLLESIRYLDKLLGQINSRKRQYQKG